MGLGPINAIYQARFNRYLHNRQIKDTSEPRVWAFLGDGEMDEPESLGAIGVAAREELDNLTFVVNCNLQRLDGPVRGNGKIIQELESYFRGAGWNVIKVVWGREWDELLARDVDGVLVNKMNTTPDGQFQTYSVEDGAYIREQLLRLRPAAAQDGRAPVRRRSCASLPRGGHDYRKVYAAFKAATEHVGQPTVILAQTIKGWTLGKRLRGPQRDPPDEEAHQGRAQGVPRPALPGDPRHGSWRTASPPYYHPGQDSDEIQYMQERRAALGGSLPRAGRPGQAAEAAGDEVYARRSRRAPASRPVATTMAFVRLLKDLMKDKEIGQRFVPIIPDEARTFGMDSMFPTAKIYSPHGQTLRRRSTASCCCPTRSPSKGQILHEGITEAGSMGSLIAAGTAYATHGEPMIPIYIFYSMFGFQRTGDSIWAMADQLAAASCSAPPPGRTTLNGEGLQHAGRALAAARLDQPGRASRTTRPWRSRSRRSSRTALRRMYGSTDEHPHGENVFYYLTVYNEPYRQPASPRTSTSRACCAGIYRYAPAPEPSDGRRGRRSSPPAWPCRRRSRRSRCSPTSGASRADVWSVTSWNELRRDAVGCRGGGPAATRRQPARVPYVTRGAVRGAPGPVIAVSDCMRAVPDQIARWVPGDYSSLGTDGFGLSDTRGALRRYFHVDAAVDRGRGAVPAGAARRGQAGDAAAGGRLVQAHRRLGGAGAGNTGGDS